MLLGIYFHTGINNYVIELSVAYKALDNIGAFKRLLGFQPNTKIAVLAFGFFHDLGLGNKNSRLGIITG